MNFKSASQQVAIAMRQAKSTFRHESLQDSKSIQEFLKAITKGMGKGKLEFSDEGGQIIMTPEGLLNFKLTAVKDDNSNRLDIKISWQQDGPEEQNRTLKIGGE